MGPATEDVVASMTDASLKADGASPRGVDQAVFRSAGEMVAGVQTVAAIVLAMTVARLPEAPAEIAAPVKAAAQAMRPLLPRGGLAGPTAAAVAPDSRALLQALFKKAGLRPSLDPHRLSWDQARKVNALMPADHHTPDVAQPFHLDVATKNGRQALHCLTQAAYYEAGGAGPVAQAAVVQVVLNRLRHPDFPKSVCGVVYEGSERDTGCQFTFTCDGSLKRSVDADAFDEARKVAKIALGGYVDRSVGTATYYHADYVVPTWAPTLVKLATVGPHIFYRMAGAEGAAAYLTGQYAGNELKLVRTVLRASDSHTQKPTREVEAKVQQASIPAGLKNQANRLQRVKVELAAAAEPKSTPAPKVETAALQPSLQAQVQATLEAAAPPPAPAAPATAPVVTAPIADAPPAA
jgi:spore germination cell wall hydrolase CwlJ-like protein